MSPLESPLRYHHPVERLNATQFAPLKPPRLKAGDRVKFVSPASTPAREEVQRGAEILTTWGLQVEIGPHAFDTTGHYLAGRDANRLADINDAVRDPGIRAIFATAGGKGAYRIADGLDFDAARVDPKPLIGLARSRFCIWRAGTDADSSDSTDRMSGGTEYYGDLAAEHLRRALMEPASITLHQDTRELTAKVFIEGSATGTLLGGNLDMIGTAVGWTCPSFAGAILLIEDVDKHIGRIDRTISQLLKSGCLDGVKGIAVGQFIRSAEEKPSKWSAVDIFKDQFAPLGVPVLGGLPIGHGPCPATVPLGTMATLDTTTRSLTIEPGVC